MISPISNSSALSAQHTLRRNQADLSTAFTRLATARRINTGKDDPAGLISSEQLAAELKSLEVQTRTLERANSQANIAEGHGQELSRLLTDLNGLVVASANSAGMSDAEIAANQMQIDSIVSSVRRFTNDAVSSVDRLALPDGGNADVEAMFNDAASAAASVASGGANSLSSGNFEAAQAAISAAIQDVATARGTIGTYQKNNIAPTIRSREVAIQNLSAARSRIADADYAVEVSNLNRAKILTTTNTQVLKIAQQQSAHVLALFSK